MPLFDVYLVIGCEIMILVIQQETIDGETVTTYIDVEAYLEFDWEDLINSLQCHFTLKQVNRRFLMLYYVVWSR